MSPAHLQFCTKDLPASRAKAGGFQGMLINLRWPEVSGRCRCQFTETGPLTVETRTSVGPVPNSMRL
jgi:hypothetical protein